MGERGKAYQSRVCRAWAGQSPSRGTMDGWLSQASILSTCTMWLGEDVCIEDIWKYGKMEQLAAEMIAWKPITMLFMCAGLTVLQGFLWRLTFSIQGKSCLTSSARKWVCTWVLRAHRRAHSTLFPSSLIQWDLQHMRNEYHSRCLC